jgi:hypothetical protein
MMANAKPLGALQAGPYVKKMLGHIAALSESGKLEEAETMARNYESHLKPTLEIFAIT